MERATEPAVKVVVASTPEQIPTAPVDGQLTVVYWNICGLAQPIRYTLALAGVECTDVRVEAGPGAPGTPEYKEMWFKWKADCGKAIAFVNLPYMLDGETKLVQTNAILRYLGRKFNLMGDPESAHLVDLVLEQTADFDGQSTGRCYRDFASMKPYCTDQLPGILAEWDRLLDTKAFMTGEKVTVADLKVYETLRKLRLIEKQPEIGTAFLAAFPRLSAFLDRVEALPAMQAYLTSDRYMERPLNNVHAQFK